MSLFQHRREASSHLHRPRGRSVRLLCSTTWGGWREIVSVWSRRTYQMWWTRWWWSTIPVVKDAGRCPLGWSSQQQEGRCVQMHCGRGEELKLQQSESRWEKQHLFYVSGANVKAFATVVKWNTVNYWKLGANINSQCLYFAICSGIKK